MAQVLAKLDGVIAGDLGHDRRELQRPLGAIPRQAGRETNHRDAVAGDVDLRHPARPLVDVRAGNAHFLRRLLSGAGGERFIVVIAEAAAKLHHQRVGPHPVVIDAGAVGHIGAGAGEVLAAAAEQPEHRRVDDLGLLETEAARDRILARDLLVDLHVERLGGLVSHVRRLEVDLAERSRKIGLGQIRENRSGNRTDAIGGNDVARKRRPARAVGVAGQRIVNDGRRGAEIAVPERHGWNGRARGAAKLIEGVLIVAEEKQPVFLERPAEREARSAGISSPAADARNTPRPWSPRCCRT